MLSISNLFKNSKRPLFFDGAMGTEMQKKGLNTGDFPDNFSLNNPEAVIDTHRAYISSGCDFLTTNTFGVAPIAIRYGIDEAIKVIEASMSCMEKSIFSENPDRKIFKVLDLGPTGKLLYPFGDLKFDEAVSIYSRLAKIGEELGADIVLVETMNDSYELKAAVLGVKEVCSLPIFATFTVDTSGRLLTGGNIDSVVALLEGMGVSALGINCGNDPNELATHVVRIKQISSLPIIVQPNAGLPDIFGNAEDEYLPPDRFSDLIGSFLDIGVHIVGGCCGSTPLHIKTVTERFYDREFPEIVEKELTAVSNYSHAVYLKDRTLAIGERINPTGKPRLKRAIIDKDFDYAIKEAQDQIDAGAEILDVNVGVLGIDEVSMLTLMVNKISSATDVPIQIDTSNIDAMAVAMRYYNGKPLVNSVNGKKESMDAVFPLIKKYGGTVVALTLDEKGIPETAEDRFEVAKNIIDTAKKHGIKKKDIIFDPLTLAVSSDSKSAEVTLKALKLIKKNLNAKTVLGISNISFGLPSREILNSSFLSMAISAGLDAVILNPLSKLVMSSLRSSNALCGYDEGFSDYIYALSEESKESVKTEKPVEPLILKKAIISGMAEKSAKITEELLTDNEPMSIVDNHLIPALDEVGIGFESGKVYLPQLLMSAEAVKASFEIIKKSFSKSQGKGRGRVVVATVEGDIHDIGKNIVKSMLENYMFDVVDLGKDVPAQEVLEATLKESTKLVGLSALMTTTVGSMEKTVRLIKSRLPECKIMVGGAVLTEEIAKKIGADIYARDAMASVRYAIEIYG